MKQHPASALAPEIREALQFVFWRQEIGCLPKGGKGASCDGIIPESLEATKLGVVIRGRVWFLPDCRCYKLDLCLLRPRFSSIKSVTVGKLDTSEIVGSRLEKDHLMIDMG